MDSQRFDHFARFIGSRSSRRQLARAALGMLAGGLFAVRRSLPTRAVVCLAGWDDCDGDGVCEDLEYNDADCGICGNNCFTFGYTHPSCCSYNCLDLAFNSANCSGCGLSCHGQGLTVPGCCWSVCVDLDNDPLNCGWCDIVCPSGICQGGLCQTPSVCPPDLTDCNGVCVDTAWDPANCGGCGIGCASQAGWGLCCFGVCVDPQTDPNNCGGCEVTCTGRGFLAPTCCWGTCVDVQTDEQHCGGCGNQCAAGQTCAGGVCTAGTQPTPTATPTATATPPPTIDKWKLWTGKTQLRGAHLLQRRVDPDRDDPALGAGPVGPVYARVDFTRLASLGANFVELVHPVPLTQNPPYKAYAKLRDNLDQLVDQAYRAGLFVVIGFRNGPGRPERALDAGTICRAGGCLVGGAGGGETELWDDEDAQDAWATAWQATAKRHRDHPAVVGYDLVVAPDSPSLTAWEDLAGRLTAAVRDVDPDTPVLVNVPANPTDLLDVRPTEDDGTVYRLDLFPPDRYLLQAHGDPTALIYPGRLDPVRDGEEGRFDQAWVLDRTLALEAFARRNDVPVAIGAYGVSRWQPGAIDYLPDALAVAEAANLNHGLWPWYPDGWTGEDAFDVERGTGPDQHEAVPNELMDAIRATWKKNKAEPPEL